MVSTKKINLNAIRIDGGTQSRVEINNEVVGDYAEAVKAGIEFPPVVVFHDGADHWLADGFHRFHAHKQAGKASIQADIRTGTVRDAILHSLGANGTHGLRRSNADKRKAVTGMLADAEWSQWSDRKIAEVCGVSHTFVALVRKPPEVATVATAKAKEPARKVATVATGTAADEDESGAKEQAPPPAPAPSTAPSLATDDTEDFGPSAEEIAAAERAQQEELDALRKIAMADDKLAAALDEAKQLRALNRVLTERNNGLMNEKTELVRRIKSLQRKLDKLEQPA